jgi:NAD(P)-dependent dehydrogenase (short-subunit alcohol dehydrogenase family)
MRASGLRRDMEGTLPDAELDETVALVTGASRGVGRGIAHELGAAGATVYVTGRSTAADRTEGLEGTVEGTADLVTGAGGAGIGVVCDHTDDASVAALFDRIESQHEGLDLLVNCAWGGYERYDGTFDDPFWTQPVERWDRMFDAGVRAAFVAGRHAVGPMLDRGSGLLVNVSSGDDGKFRGSVPYDVAKTAVDRMTAGMAHELREHGVAAVGLYPGLTRTERVEAAFERAADVPANAESPRYAGRAVVALAGDPDVLARSGGIYRTGELAREYGFTDVDGSRPAPFTFEGPRL